MPFEFLRRRQPQGQPGSGGRGRAKIPFTALTDEWRLAGRMEITGRLSDVLNKREAIPISDVRWAPVDGSGPFAPVPGLKSVDPYDLIVVVAGEESLPPVTDPDHAAQKVHKIPFDVALEAPPFRVVGTVLLHAGTEPEGLLVRAAEMFVPILNASAWLAGRRITEPEDDTLLVNRFYLRGIERVSPGADARWRGDAAHGG